MKLAIVVVSVTGVEDTAFEGDGEGVRWLLPSVHPALSSLADGVQAAHGEVEALEGGGLDREVAPGMHGPAEPVVDALDRVRGVDHGPDLGIELQERREFRPRRFRESGDRWILAAPLLVEVFEPLPRRPRSPLGRPVSGPRRSAARPAWMRTGTCCGSGAARTSDESPRARAR